MTDLDELRLYCLMRDDLGDVPRGKLMAQAGHAFVSTLEAARASEAGQAAIAQYFENEQPKIVVKAHGEAALRAAETACHEAGIPSYLVVDAGRTAFLEPTTTCLGVGPVRRTELPKIIRRMRLFE